MIKAIRRKGLAKPYGTGSTAGVQAAHAKRRRLQLAALDTAQVIDDLNIPGFGLHPLKRQAQRPLVNLGQRQLAPDLRVQGWACLRSGL